jgi:uncharacterized protein with HEPN domain
MKQHRDPRDPACLWDMLDAAKTLVEIFDGVTVERYLNERALQLIAERSLEIIGEAAKSVSVGFKAHHPEIPWKHIVAQRNVIAHEYGEIKQERLWRVVHDDMPPLVTKLEKLLPFNPQGY